MQTAPYFTAFGLLTLILSWRVVKLRKAHRVSIGHAGKQDLELHARIFGNFTEYAPLGLLFLIGLEFVQAPTWYMHLTGISLLAGRILHALGLEKGNFSLRATGMGLTYFSILIGSVGATLFSLFGFA